MSVTRTVQGEPWGYRSVFCWHKSPEHGEEIKLCVHGGIECSFISQRRFREGFQEVDGCIRGLSWQLNIAPPRGHKHTFTASCTREASSESHLLFQQTDVSSPGIVFTISFNSCAEAHLLLVTLFLFKPLPLVERSGCVWVSWDGQIRWRSCRCCLSKPQMKSNIITSPVFHPLLWGKVAWHLKRGGVVSLCVCKREKAR